MKKIFIIMLLITGLFAQFRAGTISAGALFNYSSSKDGGDYSDKQTQTVFGTKYSSSMTIQPTLSYFTQSNLSVDGFIGINTLTSEYCYPEYYTGDEECDTDEASVNILGGGATHYMNNLYTGVGVARLFIHDGDYTRSSRYLELHGGYLHNLTQNVFLDIGFSQLYGMGEHITTYDGEECNDCEDNEYSQFEIKVGIKAFFSL